MRNSDLIRLKQIAGLRLLGVSNEQIKELSGDAEATIRRYNDRLCKSLQPDDNLEQRQLKKHLRRAKQQVKGVRFFKQKSFEKVERKLHEVLDSNSEKYISFIWFGNINKKKSDDYSEQNLQSRFISPQKTAWGASSAKISDQLLQNINLSMSLIGLSREELGRFTSQLARNNAIQPDDSSCIKLPETPDTTHDLIEIAPRSPANATQKERKCLIKFALKHLERCDSNFIYAERFDRRQIDIETQSEMPLPAETWWVYGHRDILDWFECHEV